jgi:hypothetical protein
MNEMGQLKSYLHLSMHRNGEHDDQGESCVQNDHSWKQHNARSNCKHKAGHELLGFRGEWKWTFIFFLRCLLLLLKCMYMLYHILGYVLSYKEIVKWDDVHGSIILYKCIYDSKKRTV